VPTGGLERLKHDLDESAGLPLGEVEAFARIFYRPRDLHSPADHAHMQRLRPSVDRLKISAEKRATRFAKLGAYVRTYAFPQPDHPGPIRDMEMLYSFGRLLLPHLHFRVH